MTALVGIAAATAGVIASGLVLGAAGSGHCAAMCGPLVALSNPRGETTGRVASHAVLYHSGRLLTYVVLGSLIGVTGSVLASAGLGRALALAAALAVLLQAVAAWHAFRGGSHSALGALITRAIGRTGGWMRRHHVTGPAAFGALTGLLPCGLVYAALTAAAGMGTIADSAIFMLSFGLGTVPLLATVGLSAERLERRVPLRLRKAAPLALAVVALLLIMRATGGPMPHSGHTMPATPQPQTADSPHRHGL